MDNLSSGKDIASAMSKIVRSLSEEGYDVGLDSRFDSPPGSRDCFDELVTNDLIRQVSGTLFRDGHYARAVEEAFKCLNNAVKDKSGHANADGAGMMKKVFSAKSPILKLNAFQSNSDKDEQQGYMEIYAGSMTGIRNPRAHEHRLVDSPNVALELLVLANHLMRKLEGSTKQELID